MAPSHMDGEEGSNRRRMKGRRDMQNQPNAWPKLAHDRDPELLGGYANDQNHRDMVDQTFGPTVTDVEGHSETTKSWRDRMVSSSSSDIVTGVTPRNNSSYLSDRCERQENFLRSNVRIVAVVAALVMAMIVAYDAGLGSALEEVVPAERLLADESDRRTLVANNERIIHDARRAKTKVEVGNEGRFDRQPPPPPPKIGQSGSLVNPNKQRPQQGHQAVWRYPHQNTNVKPELSKPKFLQSFFKDYPDTEKCMDFKCNHDVKTCDNHDETNYKDPGPDGPCCTHILRDMLFTIDKSMGELGLDYYVGFRTLLGLARDDKIIPWMSQWTIVNDLIMDVKTLQLMTQMWDSTATGLEFITTRMGQQLRGFPGLCITSNFSGGRLAEKWQVPKRRRHFTLRGFPYTDLYLIEEMDDGTFGNEYKGCRHKKEDLFPTKKRPVYGGQFALNFPSNWEVVVQRYFGLEWRVPLKDHSQHGDYFKLCSVLYGMPHQSVKR